jgi:hypothetical protein
MTLLNENAPYCVPPDGPWRVVSLEVEVFLRKHTSTVKNYCFATIHVLHSLNEYTILRIAIT